MNPDTIQNPVKEKQPMIVGVVEVEPEPEAKVKINDRRPESSGEPPDILLMKVAFDLGFSGPDLQDKIISDKVKFLISSVTKEVGSQSYDLVSAKIKEIGLRMGRPRDFQTRFDQVYQYVRLLNERRLVEAQLSQMEQDAH